MAIAFRGVGTLVPSTGTTVQAGVPASVANTDLMILVCEVTHASEGIDGSETLSLTANGSGWAHQGTWHHPGGDMYCGVWTGLRGVVSNTMPTITASQDDTAMYAVAAAWSGSNLTVEGFVFEPTTEGEGEPDVDPTAPSVTMAGPNRTVIHWYIGENDNVMGSPSNSFTERLNVSDTTGEDTRMKAADRAFASAGASGTSTVTFDEIWSSFGLAIYEASAGAYEVDAEPASFSLTGTAATLKRGRRAAADVAAFTLGGSAATLKASRKVGAEAAAFALSGAAATFARTWRVSAAAASYSLDAATAALNKGQRVAIEAASFALNAQAAALRVARQLGANGASYALAANDATLQLASSKSIAPDPASFSLAAVAATLKQSRKLGAAAAGFSLTAQPAAVQVLRKLSVAAGSYVLTAAPAGVRVSRLVAAEPTSFSLAGVPVTLTWSGENTALWDLGLPVVEGRADNRSMPARASNASAAAMADGSSAATDADGSKTALADRRSIIARAS